MTNNCAHGLLMSGGIGDFLHYIARLRDFMASRGLCASDVIIFVESTNPNQVHDFFKKILPEFDIRFVLASIHWTRTNPLLSAQDRDEQEQRPAYRYVKAQSVGEIEDWFLPIFAKHYRFDPEPLACLCNGQRVAQPDVVVSLRDKGFLWWPTEEAFRAARGKIPAGKSIMSLGTPDERPQWTADFVTARNVLEALSIVCDSELLIATDTGFATVRELLGMPTIYCIDQYWFDRFMVRFGYWPDEIACRSASSFAFSGRDVAERVASFYAQRSR